MSDLDWPALVRSAADARPAKVPRHEGYRSAAGCLLRAEELVHASGGRAVPFSYGRSAEGSPLWGVRVGEGARRVLYVGNLHAMEFIGAEAVLAVLERLVTDPIEGLEAWLVPIANPDGRARAEANAAAGRRRFVRHNARGVDLNRNFAVGFRPDYWLHRLLPALYRPGSGPCSEPEVAALRDLCAAHPPQAAISFHAFGGWIFYPWASRAEPTPDDERFTALASRLSASMLQSYRVTQLGRWARWFRAYGAEIDHLYGRHGTLAFLIEVSKGGLDAARPATWVDPLSWFNPRDPSAHVRNVLPAAILLAVETARSSGVAPAHAAPPTG